MVEIFEQLLSLMPSIVFCVIVYGLVLGQRKVMEKAFKRVAESWYWREIFLPAGPYGTAMILAALIPSWPFPEAFMEPLSMHIAFGLFLGAISGQVYRTFWSYLKKKRAQIEG